MRLIIEGKTNRDMIKIIVSIVMSAHFVKETLLNMISGAKRIVITIDTLVNGNMMIKSKKKEALRIWLVPL